MGLIDGWNEHTVGQMDGLADRMYIKVYQRAKTWLIYKILYTLQLQLSSQSCGGYVIV